MPFSSNHGISSWSPGFGPSRFIRKRLPTHYLALQNYPIANPIMITTEYRCWKSIQRYCGICLFCQQWPEYYDLSCCFQREVWVLYSDERYLPAVMALAQAIQQSGAAEITLIRLGG